MAASISVDDWMPFERITAIAAESGETWSDELPAGERETLPAPADEVSLPEGADIPTAMRLLIAAVRRRIARGLLDVTRLRDHVRLNERDAAAADETGETRVAAWHRGQAEIWRGLAERVRADVRRDEALLEEYLRYERTARSAA